MMHPELMLIIVQDTQADRRLDASEPLVPPLSTIARTARKRLGTAMVRIGLLIGGNVLRPTPAAVASD